MTHLKSFLPVSAIPVSAVVAAGLWLASCGRGPAAETPKPTATLAQLMKGILYPASNVVFAAQSDNPADIPPAAEASMAVNPLESSYGKWEAVENASLALTEAANLLTVPGRTCSNGNAAPVDHQDWAGLVDGLRQAGKQAYEAAKAKDQDKILDVAGTLTEVCANCHNKYREVAERCK